MAFIICIMYLITNIFISFIIIIIIIALFYTIFHFKFKKMKNNLFYILRLLNID